jgi:hypothetical protein
MIVQYEAFGGMRISKGNRSTGKKENCFSATLSIADPNDLSWDGTGGVVCEFSPMLIWK